jgi:signal transduction histidine kinase
VTLRPRIGLRPRLLLALVATSAITLLAAALALLPPLQDRLRRQTVENLRAAVLASRPQIQDLVVRGDLLTIGPAARTLRSRADARIYIAHPDARLRGDPGPNDEPIYDTEQGSPAPTQIVYGTLRAGAQQVVTGATATVSVRLFNPRDRDRVVGVLVAQKQLTDVSDAVARVRNAFLAAAGVGLLVALVVGIALATTMGRRLRRLRAAALRITRQGADSPAPRDDGRDEIGDLARALGTMQRALRRQETARRAFVATASHELRTPLTSLQGTLELLEEDLRDGRFDLVDAQQQVERARGELRRLAHLAAELLDLSRLDAAVPLRDEPVELGELTRAVAAEFELRARDLEVTLEVVPPLGPCWAHGDPGAAARVLRILLDNALRYSPARETVTVAAEYHGDYATVAVADRGPWVDPEERDRIFERFERGEASAGEGGFGLGLAIGRELAERMGGRLELIEPETADDGARGARFVLRLPIELPAGSGSEPAAGSGSPAPQPAESAS